MSPRSGEAVAGGPGSPRAAGKVGAPIPWAACDPPYQAVQCARIRVPLDWDRPKGRTISLAVLITPPKGTVCQSDQRPFDPGFG